ncbi:MAG: YHS domain-containing (seleno)protein [Paracoccaceae bacterium]|jgi:YHS domain-containing protein|nr:YHS domain-containing (seleno)protein [Paracoccaceae bacterium]
MMPTRRTLLLATAATATALAAVAHAEAVFTGLWGYAIRGYDPVAYFTEGRPVEGSSDFELEWNGATWRFASAEHRALFEADPERYAPQFGGYCAWAVAQGYTASIDPDAWDIENGRLFLNYSKDVQTKWRADKPGFIAAADTNWPALARELKGQ